MPELADPLRLPCGALLPNRIAKAAMTEGLAAADDFANARHARLYRRWAAGGAGLLVTGNVMVDRRWLERPGNVVIEDKRGNAALAAWAEAGTAAGNHLWMQISHPGRQCSRMSSSRPVSASREGLKLLGLFARPRALGAGEIEDVIRRFATTAAIARETGFTGVQVHGAHGYLLAQFLSPVTNRREDEWGGPLENRARLLLEIVRATRRAVGDDFPVSVKLNSADFQKGGFDLPDCVRVAGWLAEERIDLLEVSGGTYEQPQLFGYQGRAASAAEPQRASTRRREAYFLDYAHEIRAAYPLPMMVTGGFRSRAAMVEALAAGELDVVGLGRPVCTEPDLPGRLAAGTVEGATPPPPLRLGASRWAGPASPLLLMKFLNIQGEMAWYYRQILRLADGRPPDPSLGIGPALAAHARDEWRLSRARRRARAVRPDDAQG
ncbi:MAG TPA: NADH:flavin oxidoreductase/NADH oxidase family protein [Gammaproteobacteria bacterium]|nr:NADH:flavin oxidoreductase/NADH oxidase family protein [Gammaproteobacteria bacterium]